MNIDIEQFIMEIESRPAIWDMKSSEYSDKFKKIKQWEEIITLFSELGISDKDKKEKGRILQAKWKNLKDSFMRECRKQGTLKSGAGASSKSQYRFYNQLLFLKPFAGKNDTQSSMSIEVENETIGGPHAEMPPPKKRSKKIDSTQEIERDILDILKSSLNQTETANQDPDRLFMLSLVPDFKKVPDRLKSAVKLNLLKCLLEAQGHSEQLAYSEQHRNYDDYGHDYGHGYFTNSASTSNSYHENVVRTTQDTRPTNVDNPVTPAASRHSEESEILSLFND